MQYLMLTIETDTVQYHLVVAEASGRHSNSNSVQLLLDGAACWEWFAIFGFSAGL